MDAIVFIESITTLKFTVNGRGRKQSSPEEGRGGGERADHPFPPQSTEAPTLTSAAKRG